MVVIDAAAYYDPNEFLCCTPSLSTTAGKGLPTQIPLLGLFAAGMTSWRRSYPLELPNMLLGAIPRTVVQSLSPRRNHTAAVKDAR